MAYPPLKGREVVFKNIGGVYVPLRPWPQHFYISRELLNFNLAAIEVRPLTFMGLFKGIGKNFISMNFWRFCYLLRKAGFLTTAEGECYSWKHLTWKIWA